MDVGAEIFNYNLHMLPGTELNDPASRDSHIKKTAWRLFDGCYGIYEGKKVFEGEEVVVATSTMPEEELRSFRLIHFLIQLMWSKEWYKDLLCVFRQWGTHPADAVVKIAAACQNDDGPMGEVTRRFRADHDLEKFENFQDLSDYWSETEAFERLAAGGYGKLNYVYTFTVLLDHRRDFDDLLLRVAHDMAQTTGITDPDEFIHQCQEVLRFSQALQFDLSGVLSESSNQEAAEHVEFDYDVLGWKTGGYQHPLEASKNGKFNYEFYLPDEQRAFLKTQLQQFKSHNVNMTIRKLSEGVSPDHLLYKVRPSHPREGAAPIQSQA